VMADRARGRRNDYTWQGVVNGSALASGASASVEVVNVGNAVTLMRTRGLIACSMDGPTDGNKAILGVGLIVGTEEQLATGATAFPNPVSDIDAEWIWHANIPLLA